MIKMLTQKELEYILAELLDDPSEYKLNVLAKKTGYNRNDIINIARKHPTTASYVDDWIKRGHIRSKEANQRVTEQRMEKRREKKMRWSEGELHFGLVAGKKFTAQLISGKEELQEIIRRRLYAERVITSETCNMLRKEQGEIIKVAREKTYSKFGKKYGTYLDKELHSTSLPARKTVLRNIEFDGQTLSFQGTIRNTVGSIKWLDVERQQFKLVGTEIVWQIIPDLQQDGYYNEPYLKENLKTLMAKKQIPSMKIWHDKKDLWEGVFSLSIDETKIDKSCRQPVFIVCQVVSDEWGMITTKAYNSTNEQLWNDHFHLNAQEWMWANGNDYINRRKGKLLAYNAKIYRRWATKWRDMQPIIIIKKPRLDNVPELNNRLPWKPHIGNVFMVHGAKVYTTFENSIEDIRNRLSL